MLPSWPATGEQTTCPSALPNTVASSSLSLCVPDLLAACLCNCRCGQGQDCARRTHRSTPVIRDFSLSCLPLHATPRSSGGSRLRSLGPLRGAASAVDHRTWAAGRLHSMLDGHDRWQAAAARRRVVDAAAAAAAGGGAEAQGRGAGKRRQLRFGQRGMWTARIAALEGCRRRLAHERQAGRGNS